MNDFLNLFKLQAKSSYGISALCYNMKHNSKEAYQITGRIGAILIAAACLIFSYFKTIAAIFIPLKQVGLEQLVLLLGFLTAFLFVIIFGFFYILGTMFFARDTAFLASLPVRQGSIFASKLALVMLGEFLISTPLMAVPAIYYGAELHAGVFFYIKLAVLSVFIPMVPLSIASVLCLVFMRLAANIKRRNIFQVLGVFIIVAGIISVQGILLKSAAKNMGTYLSDGTAGNAINMAAASIGKYLPHVGWAMNALTADRASGIIYLLLFTLVSLASMAAAILISSRIYQKGALAHNEALKEGMRSSYTGRNAHSATYSLFILEWKTILRTPVFAINSLFPIILGPLLFAMPSSSWKGNTGEIIYSSLSSSSYSSYIVLFAAGLLALPGIMNPAAATPISREGKTFWVSKMIPVSPCKQLEAKLLAAYSISFLAVLTTSGMLSYVFKLGAVHIAAGTLLTLIALIPITITYILIDLSRPKLIWDSPTQAIKQNMNVIISLAAGAVIAILPGYFAYLALAKGADMILVYAVLMLLYIIMAIAAYRFLVRSSERLYTRLEL